MRKRTGMRYKFIKRKFITYLLTFTLPVLIMGALILTNLYRMESKQVEERLEGSIHLAEGILDGFASDVLALNRYLINGRQLSSFYQTFTKEQVDYASSLTLGQLSAYLNSMGTSRLYIDSVYFYMENKLKRVLTSEKTITNIESMGDSEWVSLLSAVKSGSPEIIGRTVQRDAFSGEAKLCSIFLHFTAWKGGVVVNYRRSAIEEGLENSVFYGGEQLIVFGSDGLPLFSRNPVNPELLSHLEKQLEEDPEAGSFHFDNKKYRIKQADYAPLGAAVVTLVPEWEIYATLFDNIQIIILMVLVTAVSSAILSYYRAIHNYSQLSQIMDIFEKAERNEELPGFVDNDRDLYSKILSNLVHTFVQNSYLKMQLSERKYRQMAAELIALQYQINPHFLFNTLQTINYEVLHATHGTFTTANQMVEYLSDILRYSLGSPEEKVPLRQEAGVCMKYIEIQKLRYNKEIETTWKLDQNAADLPVQRMLLQPLLENAISHGLRFKEEQCRIAVRVSPMHGKIRVVVGDNGCGMSRERLKEVRESLKQTGSEFPDKHIGLVNISQRLALSYSADSVLHIYSKEGAGTILYFDVPADLT